MENLMFLVGFISQWAKANPKIPSILVVLGVCVLGYAGYWLVGYDPSAHAEVHGWLERTRLFLKDGSEWALKGVFALQTTSAAASGLKQLNLPAGVQDALPVTKN